jgi:subtilisin family serine protease
VSDTGVQHDHPSLLKSYRGYTEGKSVDHNYNWFDATSNHLEIPEDDNGHGTFCTGLACGGNDGRKSEIYSLKLSWNGTKINLDSLQIYEDFNKRMVTRNIY